MAVLAIYNFTIGNHINLLSVYESCLDLHMMLWDTQSFTSNRLNLTRKLNQSFSNEETYSLHKSHFCMFPDCISDFLIDLWRLLNLGQSINFNRK
jgi:hypothetical protein